MAVRLRSTIFLLAIYIAFFASGASCLMAEVTWNRMLIVVVGNSMNAAAIIVGVFMGGLGAGSFAGGRFFIKRRASLVPYLLLESAIGVYVLLSSFLFELLSELFSSWAVAVDFRAGVAAVRIFVTVAALFLPAFLMGATFPAIINGAAHSSPSRRTARTGYLYGINTLGAAVGCYVAGWILLLELGVQATLSTAFALYMVAVLCALAALAVSQRKPIEAPAPVPQAESAPAPDRRLWRFLAAATFGIGFVSLAYEVILTRLGIIVLGNTIRVFPLVLTSFILGIGISSLIGTWLYGVLSRHTKRADSLFGIIALAAGGVVFVTPYFLLGNQMFAKNLFDRFVEPGLQNPLPVLVTIIAPTILIGALLPVAIRMLQPEGRGEATKEAATLYALNTAGGMLGAVLANHYFVPIIGVHNVIVFLTCVSALVGFAGLFPRARSLVRVSVAVAGAVALAVVLAVYPPEMMEVYAEKVGSKANADSFELLHMREGSAAIVTVHDQRDNRWGSFRDMHLNGIEEASTRYYHVQLFKLLGFLPVLKHDDPKDVLVIAFGAGITAGSVLASEEVESLDVVDLNPDVEGINDLFTEVNGDVFHKPRLHFHNDDGRNYLLTSNKQYDVIISDSTHPRAYDSWILYTREFYESVRDHLRPGGIFAQWVPVLFDMQGKLMRIHLNTFRHVFPHATMWYVYGSDQAFLLATPGPFSIDAVRLQRKLDRLPKWFRAEEYQIDTVARIGSFFWLDGYAMSQMIGRERRINTDDMHYIDKQSALWPLPPNKQLPAFQASVLQYLKRADEDTREIAHLGQRAAHWLARFGFFGDKRDLFMAYCIMPENGLARYYTSRAFSGMLPDYKEFCRKKKQASR